MIQTEVDFAIMGSDPVALLLAGILACVHRQRVVIIGEPRSALALSHSIDLSIAPITRPETWALLGQTVPETARLIARLGAKSSLTRVDPILFAETPTGLQGLGFMAHAARAAGHLVEPGAPGAIGGRRQSLKVRDAIWLNRALLCPALERWLEQTKVRRLPLTGTAIALRADGGVQIDRQGEHIIAAQAVLADDAAIVQYLDPAQRQPHLYEPAGTSVLTEHTGPLAAPVMMSLDTAVVLMQSPSRAVSGFCPLPAGTALPAIAELLADHRHLRLSGQSSFCPILTKDGAPLCGPLDTGPTVLAGFGPLAAFLAPAIARHLVDRPEHDEAAYFAARGSRDMAGSTVAEYAAVPA